MNCISSQIQYTKIFNFTYNLFRILWPMCRSQWPRGLRRRSAAARLLRLWVRIPPGAWMFVCCECCVLSGRGLCDELITRPEKSYRLWCVVVCDLETSRIRRPWPALGRRATAKKKIPSDLCSSRSSALCGILNLFSLTSLLLVWGFFEEVCFRHFQSVFLIWDERPPFTPHEKRLADLLLCSDFECY